MGVAISAQSLFEPNFAPKPHTIKVIKPPPKKKNTPIYTKKTQILRKRRVYCRSVKGIVPEYVECAIRIERVCS